MFYLIYISSATKLMDDDELLFLLEQSREKNLKLNVTGMLLYKDGCFMQMLEGEKQAVLDLYKTIVVDHRHKGVITIITGDIEKRNFKDWSMGFCNIDKAADLPKFNDYIEENLTLKQFNDDSKYAYQFMVKFNELNPY